jgi:hypothetical protein
LKTRAFGTIRARAVAHSCSDHRATKNARRDDDDNRPLILSLKEHCGDSVAADGEALPTA